MTTATPRGRSTPIDWALALALCAATLWAYWGTWRNGFIQFDDPGYVYENEVVLRGLDWSGVRWALTTGHASNWHPLTWISHMLDVELFGADPAGQHVTSLVLHMLASVLLFVVLLRTTRARWPSAFVAAAFALHPTHVESVAWIAERKDVLSGVCMLLAVWAYVRWVERPGWGRYAVLGACCALGLMAKPMLVTLPAVLLLLDVWPLRRLALGSGPAAGPVGAAGRTFGALLREKLPLFALSLASCVVTFAVQHAAGAVQTVEHIPLVLRVENALVAYVRYLALTFWPVDLAVYYPLHAQLPAAKVLGAAALLGALTALAYRVRRERPYALVGWLWFAGMLVPVIGIVQVGQQALADRYTYLPTIGVFIAVAWWIGSLARSDTARQLAGWSALCVLLALGCITRHQLRFWKDTGTLFERTLAVTEDNALAEHLLGRWYLAQGDAARALARLEEARRLNPKDSDVHMGIAAALGALGRMHEAVEPLRTAVVLAPKSAKAHYNLGFVLDQTGALREAIDQYNAALALDPGYTLAQERLARAIARRDRKGH